MDQGEFSTAERDAFQYWRFHHPRPQVQRKMAVLYLRSPGVSGAEVCRLCALSPSTDGRYLRAYRSGGSAKLQAAPGARRPSELADYQVLIVEELRQRPPASVAEAAQRIAQRTGLKRGPTQVRQFRKAGGRKPRKVGQIPAKADGAAQATFPTQAREPRLAQAQAGQRRVFFLDAAHCVFAPFLGVVWCFTRLFVKAPSGRQRVHVLAALDALTHAVVTVTNLTSLPSIPVCELLRLLAGAYPDLPLTIVLDNARYQRGHLVQTLAQSLGIELLFFPPYSPNLHLSELIDLNVSDLPSGPGPGRRVHCPPVSPPPKSTSTSVISSRVKYNYQVTGAGSERSHWLALLAEAHGKVGQTEEGLRVLAEALAEVHQNGVHYCKGKAELYRLRGALTLQGTNQKAKSKNQKVKIGTSPQYLVLRRRWNGRQRSVFSTPSTLPAGKKQSPGNFVQPRV